MPKTIIPSKRHLSAGRLAILPGLAAALIVLLAACAGPAASNSQTSVSSGAAPASAAPAGAVSFSKDVLPILQSRCVNCHGGQKTEKGLDMTSYDKLMAGSENGSVVTAGSPDNSNLIKMIQQGKMPKSGPKLLPAQVQMLVDWVTAGAKNN
jgi:mono/diheme cytochrome c family protein